MLHYLFHLSEEFVRMIEVDIQYQHYCQNQRIEKGDHQLVIQSNYVSNDVYSDMSEELVQYPAICGHHFYMDIDEDYLHWQHKTNPKKINF